MTARHLTHDAPPAAGGRLLAFEARAMGSPLRLTVVVPSGRTRSLDRATDAWLAVRDEFRL
jgi:hypothetical protein